jgi:hypothetical protein
LQQSLVQAACHDRRRRAGKLLRWWSWQVAWATANLEASARLLLERRHERERQSWDRRQTQGPSEEEARLLAFLFESWWLVRLSTRERSRLNLSVLLPVLDHWVQAALPPHRAENLQRRRHVRFSLNLKVRPAQGQSVRAQSSRREHPGCEQTCRAPPRLDNIVRPSGPEAPTSTGRAVRRSTRGPFAKMTSGAKAKAKAAQSRPVAGAGAGAVPHLKVSLQEQLGPRAAGVHDLAAALPGEDLAGLQERRLEAKGQAQARQDHQEDHLAKRCCKPPVRGGRRGSDRCPVFGSGLAVAVRGSLGQTTHNQTCVEAAACLAQSLRPEDLQAEGEDIEGAAQSAKVGLPLALTEQPLAPPQDAEPQDAINANGHLDDLMLTPPRPHPREPLFAQVLPLSMVRLPLPMSCASCGGQEENVDTGTILRFFKLRGPKDVPRQPPHASAISE